MSRRRAATSGSGRGLPHGAVVDCLAHAINTLAPRAEVLVVTPSVGSRCEWLRGKEVAGLTRRLVDAIFQAHAGVAPTPPIVAGPADRAELPVSSPTCLTQVTSTDSSVSCLLFLKTPSAVRYSPLAAGTLPVVAGPAGRAERSPSSSVSLFQVQRTKNPGPACLQSYVPHPSA
jgi:hypothetical protein